MSTDRHVQGAENRLTGQWGEAVVAEDLRRHGWSIQGAGVRCRMGEIDLVAVKDGILAFIEVKLRRSADYGLPAEAVTFRKQERLRAAAQIYLARYPTDLQPRFDVAEVYAPQGRETQMPKISYIENAF